MRPGPLARAGALSAALAVAVACTAAPAEDGRSGSPPPDEALDRLSVPGDEAPAATIPPRSTTSSTAFLPTTIAAAPALTAPAGGSCPASAHQGLLPAAPTPPASVATRPVPPGPPGAPGSAAPVPPTSPPVTPASLTDDLRRDPRLAGTTVSVSVWVDGWGEIVAENPDTALIPASNQKLFTAVGALTLLDPSERLPTDVVATGPMVDGVVQGDLVLVGGGDPWLTLTGPSSIDALAAQVQAAGVREVTGAIVVDESRYDAVRTLDQWPADWIESIGPLSALAADHNMFAKHDSDVLADPARRIGEVLRFALAARGVAVAGEVRHGVVPAGVRVARTESPTISELVTVLLDKSDNLIAELLVKEIGHRATGGPGTTAAGLAAIARVTSPLCGPDTGTSADGSGLSRNNRHSARQLRRLVQAAAAAPWGRRFVEHLPVSGTPGTLGGRLSEAPAGGRVRAKGGSLAVTRSLSGMLTTVGGRAGVFSIVVNGSSLDRSTDAAIDDLVTKVVSMPG